MKKIPPNKVAEWARDAAGVAGGGLVSYGAWMAWDPAGFIVAGVLLLAVAYLTARASA
jgi:hypothetical protein